LSIKAAETNIGIDLNIKENFKLWDSLAANQENIAIKTNKL
jgi:hypothetical protein